MVIRMEIREYLQKNRLMIDGSMGTYYSTLKGSSNLMSELANLTEPEVIERIHREYIDAGASMIKTNTFAANRVVLDLEQDKKEEIIKVACEIAKRAAKSSGKDIMIAGDIGPIPVMVSFEEEKILDEYRETIDFMLQENIHIFHFESFSDNRYIFPMAAYIKQKDENAFIIASYCINKNGYTSSLKSAARLLEEAGNSENIDACGFNCGIGPGHMYQIFKHISLPTDKYIIAAPNASYPEQIQNRMVFLDNIKYYKENMKRLADLGIQILGGCCGTNPDYVKEVATSCKGQIPELNEGVHTTSLPSKAPVRPNDFYELFNKKKVIAVELDPPFDANVEKVMECAMQLKEMGVDILTFADSPMGRSRIDSILMSIKVAEEVGIPVMPHVCCRDKNLIAMRSGILGAYINQIRNFLIVTGDPVPVESRTATTGVFDYTSIHLMEYVHDMNQEHFPDEPLYYGGALNYARGQIDKVVERMQKKIDAGAKYFLTQPIYSDEDIERIREIKQRVDTKILCGIMPFVSYRNANFIRNEITGISVPDEIIARYREDMSKEEGEMTGALLAIELMDKLAPYADGYYFMLPFNRVSMMEKIMKMRLEL